MHQLHWGRKYLCLIYDSFYSSANILRKKERSSVLAEVPAYCAELQALRGLTLYRLNSLSRYPASLCWKDR